MPERFDVVIVGAGPAGSSLATRLVRSGYRVALLDRKLFPRGKPCGEFLSPECAPALAELGVLDRVTARAGLAVHGMRLYGYGCQATGAFKTVGRSRVPQGLGGGYAVAREILDAELLDAARAAGASVLEGVTCRGLLRSGDHVDGVVGATAAGEPFELRASWTIGADGVRSIVARELGVQRRIPWLDKFALTTRFANVPALPTAELHLFAGGYFAAAPIAADTLSLNLVVDRARLRERAGSGWDTFLAEHLAHAPALAERLQSAHRSSPVRGIGPLAYRTTGQVSAGAALVGDACGYVDPMTGEGIFFALRTAELLARELDRALARRDRSAGALRPYARARRREIGPRLLLSKLLQTGLRSAPIARAVLQGLEARSGFADLLVSFTGDYVRFRDAMRPTVWWRALVDKGAA